MGDILNMYFTNITLFNHMLMAMYFCKFIYKHRCVTFRLNNFEYLTLEPYFGKSQCKTQRKFVKKQL